MIIHKTNYNIQTMSLYPGTNWMEEYEPGQWALVPPELEEKAMQLAPYCELVFKGDGLVDILDDPELRPKLSPAELRKRAYETMREDGDGGPLILWEGEPLTVDEASASWLRYYIEGHERADALRQMVIAAKGHIRGLFPGGGEEESGGGEAL